MRRDRLEELRGKLVGEMTRQERRYLANRMRLVGLRPDERFEDVDPGDSVRPDPLFNFGERLQEVVEEQRTLLDLISF